MSGNSENPGVKVPDISSMDQSIDTSTILTTISQVTEISQKGTSETSRISEVSKSLVTFFQDSNSILVNSTNIVTIFDSDSNSNIISTSPVPVSSKVFQIASIAVFYFAILLVGVWASRKAEKKSKNLRISSSPSFGSDTLKFDEADDVMLAGRSIGLIVGIFTMTATWVGGAYICGTAQWRNKVKNPRYAFPIFCKIFNFKVCTFPKNSRNRCILS